MSNQDSPDTTGEAPPDDHLVDVEDGAGCTEIWAHLSEQRTHGD